MRNLPILWLALVLGLMPVARAAAEPATSATIGSDEIILGVSSDAALAATGVGLQYTPSHADGILGTSWDLSVEGGSSVLSRDVESFTSTAFAASSSVRVSSPAGDPLVRVVHDFHPAADGQDVYEVVVRVQNVSNAAVQATYSRTLTWTAGPATAASLQDPAYGSLTTTPDGLGLDWALSLPRLEPGDTTVLRLYFGAAASGDAAVAALEVNGASLISEAPGGPAAFVFGVAAGAGGVRGGTHRAAGSAGSSALVLSHPGGSTGSGAGATVASAPTTDPIWTNPVTTPTTTTTTSTTSTGASASTGTSATTETPPGATDDRPASDDSSGAPPDLTPTAPSTAATPELDAFALFGSGLLGFGSYAVLVRRARRKP